MITSSRQHSGKGRQEEWSGQNDSKHFRLYVGPETLKLLEGNRRKTSKTQT